jgi:hypothetical protein
MRVLPHDREIGVGARAWRARIPSREPESAMAMPVRLVRILPHDRGSGVLSAVRLGRAMAAVGIRVMGARRRPVPALPEFSERLGNPPAPSRERRLSTGSATTGVIRRLGRHSLALGGKNNHC